MTSKEISAAIDSAANGASKILAIAKHNINNQTANLVRKVFGNRFSHENIEEACLTTADGKLFLPGSYLTTQAFSPDKNKSLTFHKLVLVSDDGQTVIDGDDFASLDFAHQCYTYVSQAACVLREKLLQKGK